MYVLKKVFFVLVLITLLFNCNDKFESVQDIVLGKDYGKPSVCKEGMMCGEDKDCFDGRCVQGVCRCNVSFCQKDEDCGENKCCNVLNGTCYDCYKDVFALDTSEDNLSDVYFDIIISDDTEFQDTESFTCKKDLDCPLNIPYCDPKKGICVECYEDGHCKEGGCNISVGKCNVLDAGFDVITEDTIPDTQFDVGSDVIMDIQVDVITDPCENYICICDSVCVVKNGNPDCVSGCKTDSDCCANKVCKNGMCEKTTCSDDSDCKDVSKPHCDVISGLCYECVNDTHCQSNYYCDGNRVCKYKVDECYGTCDPNTQWCNPVKKQCEDIPSNWCATCTEILDPICFLSGLTCGLTTKKCTKQCSDDSECFGYTCNFFGWCSCP